MLYVKITKEEALKLGSREYGLTGGKGLVAVGDL
jgi:hypothetical protein